jgi:hypothetical protein
MAKMSKYHSYFRRQQIIRAPIQMVPDSINQKSEVRGKNILTALYRC